MNKNVPLGKAVVALGLLAYIVFSDLPMPHKVFLVVVWVGSFASGLLGVRSRKVVPTGGTEPRVPVQGQAGARHQSATVPQGKTQR